jgi:hypothetical protein
VIISPSVNIEEGFYEAIRKILIEQDRFIRSLLDSLPAQA